MTERVPTPAELAAVPDALFQMLKESPSILEDGSERQESREVLNQRLAQLMAAVAPEVDEASLDAVDAYLAVVEDGSPIRRMRQALLSQVLAQMFGDG
jgi:hypothetical protein